MNTNPSKKRLKARMSRKQMEITILALLALSLIAFYFLLVTSIPMPTGEITPVQVSKEYNLQKEDMQQIISLLIGIDDSIQNQSLVIQEASENSLEQTKQLESMNLAFLSWAEKQGLISRGK